MVFACRTEEDRELSEQPTYGRDSSCVHPGYKPKALLSYNPAQKKMFYFSRKLIRDQIIQIFISQNAVSLSLSHTHTHTHVHHSATQLGLIELHCRVVYVCILCDTYLINKHNGYESPLRFS